jgi:hypothetical protein
MLSHAETTTAMLIKKFGAIVFVLIRYERCKLKSWIFQLLIVEFGKGQQLVNFQIKKIYY